ncbi:MAG: response regulator transcription factor [Nevskia sp.]|nr:response regulator transcription factor [Nevskia sp.]
MKRCLYLADCPDTALLRALREGGGRCRTAKVREAQWALACEPCDVIVCEESDAMAGIAAALPPDTMLLAVLERDDKDLRVAALRAGADACLSRPVSILEVGAVIDAFFRRRSRGRPCEHQGAADEDSASGQLVLAPGMRSAVFQGRRLALSPREFELLNLLLRAEGAPLERAAIWHGIWGEAQEPNPDLIDQAVLRLRRKLGGCPVRIVSVRNVGYRAEGLYRLA